MRSVELTPGLHADSGLAGLQLKIVAEDKVIDSRITDLIAEWEREK